MGIAWRLMLWSWKQTIVWEFFGSRTGTHHEQKVKFQKSLIFLLGNGWKFFFQSNSPSGKVYTTRSTIFAPPTFQNIYHSYLSHINTSQLTQEFSRTSGKGCVGENLTPPSGESAHEAIGKLKNVSDWPVRKRVKPTDGKNATYISKSPINCRL